MDTVHAWQNETLGRRAIEALNKNGFSGHYFASAQEAVDWLLAQIPANASVGFGGSETAHGLNLPKLLADKGCTIFDHHTPGLSKEDNLAVRRSQLTADCFICSTNALTMTGELVNRDGVGNRVAAMIFGPKTVYVLAGINKLVADPKAAEERLRRVACPLNNKRLGRPNPCVEHGECVDCRSDSRICRITTVLSRKPTLTGFHVLVVGEELGY